MPMANRHGRSRRQLSIDVYMAASSTGLADMPPSWKLEKPAPNSQKSKLVPLAGLEPARCFHHLILSQARLPIPPQGLDPRDHSGEAQGVNGPIPLPLSHRYMGRRSMGTTSIRSRRRHERDGM